MNYIHGNLHYEVFQGFVIVTDLVTTKQIGLNGANMVFAPWLEGTPTKYSANYFIAKFRREQGQENSVLNWMEENFFEGDSEVYSLSPTETISKELTRLPSWFDLYQ